MQTLMNAAETSSLLYKMCTRPAA